LQKFVVKNQSPVSNLQSPIRKICVVITARPSYARIKTVLEAIQQHPRLELQLVVGASALLERYGEVVNIIRADGFEPNAVVYMVVEGENLVTTAKSTGMGLMELATIFDNLKPDVVISVADRYETIATAIAAAYLNIPVAHVQGGEVTGSIDEKVRHAVTKLANLHFVSNTHAAERVIRLGEDPATVFVTGCPSVDLAARVLAEKPEQFDPLARYGGVGHAFDPSQGYLVVMQHPVTTEYKDALSQIQETLSAVETLRVPTFWFWPNVDAGSDRISKGIRHFRETHDVPFMYFFKNLAPEDFLRLLIGARCLIGNSSVGIRESAYLGVPVVNIGNRQAGRERGPNVIDVGYDSAAIIDAARRHLANGRYPSSALYGDGCAGERIANLLADVPLTIEKKITY
jgi:UDP-hydrolysing UDP-N-acetyl-D-glucosamine 2-epimerase